MDREAMILEAQVGLFQKLCRPVAERLDDLHTLMQKMTLICVLLKSQERPVVHLNPPLSLVLR